MSVHARLGDTDDLKTEANERSGIKGTGKEGNPETENDSRIGFGVQTGVRMIRNSQRATRFSKRVRQIRGNNLEYLTLPGVIRET